MPAAAPAPDRNMLGIAHNGALAALMPDVHDDERQHDSNAVVALAGQRESEARPRRTG